MSLLSNLQQWRTTAFRRENVAILNIGDCDKIDAIKLAYLRAELDEYYEKLMPDRIRQSR
jgi:hypothetical protein